MPLKRRRKIVEELRYRIEALKFKKLERISELSFGEVAR